ncbi:M20 family metallo-hydrolase [Falsirhodobacter sp. alg1]|uniref:M20 family metallo-hydrolase n=1 Tax=Falsirhodobacter sp. alg1 TaxID=1472418 RepID=UPI0005EE06CF|nr:M20 family metallo-hydrolase [Falsirhodobacter sp. alg1]
MSNLIVNENRLWDDLMVTAEFGAKDGGVCRLTLGPEDKAVRDWFSGQCNALGLEMAVDEVGNMFALRKGRSDLPPIAMGSHLDTQPTGGRFDGILGVLAGLEVIRVLEDAGYVTEAPLMLVNWTNEEGSRFNPSMLGSGVYCGVHERSYADARQDEGGETFGDALEAIGYRGDRPAGSVELGAMFELHIEQGPILEAEGASIGIVQGVQGCRWYEVVLTGNSAHTGSTPMGMRQDALVAASHLVVAVQAMALAEEDAVGSVGFMEVLPNSTNVIPGVVRLNVDLRHPKDAVLDRMEASLQETVASLGVTAKITPISRTDAVEFDTECITSVRHAVSRLNMSARDIVSGAGHDAQHLAGHVPTTMIFVPSTNGLSHNPAEYTAPAECANGAQVLLEAVLDYDRRMSDPVSAP